MSVWETLDYCQHTGLKKLLGYDDETDSVLIKYEQDATSLLDSNKEAQAEGFDKRSDMWHAAAVPTIVTFERSEEHTSELQSLMRISYAVFCLKKNKKIKTNIQ